jgi:hypothetical protein
MPVKLLGLYDMSFDTKDGKKIDGVKIYVAYKDVENEGIIGTACAQIFLKRRIADGVNLIDYIGKNINLAFNMKGKVVAVSPAV